MSNIAFVSLAPTVSPPKPIAQQTIPSWDDDFDHSDVATTVVEATLAEVNLKLLIFFSTNFFSRIMIIPLLSLLKQHLVFCQWNRIPGLHLSFHNLNNEHQ